MRKMLLISSLMVMVLLILALPGSAGAMTSHTDSAKGQGVLVYGAYDEHFKFTVQAQGNDPLANPAKGKFSTKRGGFFAKGTVTCLDARSDGFGGSAANFVGQIKKSSDFNGLAGLFIDFNAYDSGQPKGQGDAYDEGVPSVTSQCQAPVYGGSLLEKGSVVVHPG